MQNKMIIFSIVILLFISACTSSKKQTYIEYNTLARTSQLTLTESDGYIVSIEKRPRGIVGSPDKGYTIRFQEDNQKNTKRQKAINKKFNKLTNDQVLLVTHISKFYKNNNEKTYNAYSSYSPDDPLCEKNVEIGCEIDYEKSYVGLEKFKNEAIAQIKKENIAGTPYSHILIMSMGWNNNQYDSIWRYDQILKNIKIETKKAGINFKPLVIGFTWPSVWNGVNNSFISTKAGHLASYLNKANDADEIGFTVANWIINKQIPEIKKSCCQNGQVPKIIAIGHSFGARLLSRAIFSKNYIRNIDKNKQPIDTFIALQGAFSVNRFIKNKSDQDSSYGGGEGAPYADFIKLNTNIVLTSSKNDSANNSAIFKGAPLIGGKYGLKKAKKNKEIFSILNWPIEKDKLKETLSINKVVVTDVTDIVMNHNDILGPQMGKLIFSILANKKSNK